MPALALVALALVIGTSRGAIINVPLDQPTTQQAIDAAADGDTVLLAPGAYSEEIDFLGKPISVESGRFL